MGLRSNGRSRAEFEMRQKVSRVREDIQNHDNACHGWVIISRQLQPDSESSVIKLVMGYVKDQMQDLRR